MDSHTRPTFGELSSAQCIAVLERNQAGRIAFTFHDRVDIEPISYVYHDDWLYFRTSEGTKLDTVRHHPWVAFEVDEVRARFDWESVVVRGTIYFLNADAPGRVGEEYAAALAVLREHDPDVLTPADLTPQRQSLFRVHADEISGRVAYPG
jgi:nitroimidazol reductase NimA-like FMN-containing flavoprotein (pyridoxamine 5'-phosphate oxidase superfamily)